MDLKKMYQQSLENAFELTKVAKTKDDVGLVKADVYSKIALAIATAMVDVEEKGTENTIIEHAAPVAAAPEPIEPGKEEKVDVNPAIVKLVQDEPVPLPPDHIEDEDEESRKKRYEYLLHNYKDTLMKDLPEEVYPFLLPEANINAAYEWLWDEALKDDSAKRKESIVRDFSERKLSQLSDVPLSLYLEKIIPCEQDWIYFMMFENPDTINNVLAKCTSNRYKDFRNLSNFSVGVWHTATQKYMENNFEAIEKVS